MTTTSRAVLELLYRDKASKGVQQSQNKISGALKNMTSSALTFGAALIGPTALISAVNQATEAFNRKEQAVATMEQVMKSMGRYTPELSARMQEYANTLQKVTLFSDEAIIEGIGFLQTYKQIGDDVMPQAISVMADIAQLMGGDMRTAANKVGKAAMGLTGELREVGITIDDDVAASGDFVAILGEIEKQVGGVARAAGDTAAGKIAQMKHAMNDAGEAMGALLSPAVISGAGFLEALANSAQKVAEALQRMGQVNYGEQLVTFGEDLQKFAGEVSEMSGLELAKMLEELNAEVADLDTNVANATENHELLYAKLKIVGELYNSQLMQLGDLNGKLREHNELVIKSAQAYEQAALPAADYSTWLSDWFPVAVGYVDQFADSLAYATLQGQHLGKALLNTVESLMVQLTAKAGLLTLFYGLLTAMGIGAPITGIGFGNFLTKSLFGFASGGDFITNGPTPILVGDNPGGREHVQVTPLSSPNVNGPQGGATTIHLSFDDAGLRDLVRVRINDELVDMSRSGQSDLVVKT